MRYRLLKADALNKTDAPLPSDTLMKEVVEYYDRHGDANERMRAHYLLGRVYHPKTIFFVVQHFTKEKLLQKRKRPDLPIKANLSHYS